MSQRVVLVSSAVITWQKHSASTDLQYIFFYSLEPTGACIWCWQDDVIPLVCYILNKQNLVEFLSKSCIYQRKLCSVLAF